jgi:hypothetical protein
VKIVIEIFQPHYDPLLEHVDQDSREYEVLRNAVLLRYPERAAPTLVVVCEPEEAKSLLDCAQHFCPEAVPQIAEAITMHRLP